MKQLGALGSPALLKCYDSFFFSLKKKLIICVYVSLCLYERETKTERHERHKERDRKTQRETEGGHDVYMTNI